MIQRKIVGLEKKCDSLSSFGGRSILENLEEIPKRKKLTGLWVRRQVKMCNGISACFLLTDAIYFQVYLWSSWSLDNHLTKDSFNLNQNKGQKVGQTWFNLSIKHCRKSKCSERGIIVR